MRKIRWMGGSKHDLSAFPPAAKGVFGQALFEVQSGETPDMAKPLPQFGSGVFELRDEIAGNAYRTIYAVKLRKAVYVLHAFQKKSKSGRAMPREDINRIRERLKQAKLADEE